MGAAVVEVLRRLPLFAGLSDAAIGAIATGLRVILGLERSHLGSD